jgi:cleavage and polyadenylation specificity factor subunit 1
VPTSLFVAVGTAHVDNDSEDTPGKGRILLFEIVKKAVGEESKKVGGEEIPLLSLAYEKNILLGPVTVIQNLPSGDRMLLVVGAGSEVTIERWKEKKLVQVGFHHANMHVLKMTIFKSMILLQDAYDGCQFLVWRDSDQTLTLLSRDYNRTVTFAAGVMSMASQIAFCVHDDRENIVVLQYAPDEDASRGGHKLVHRSDMHIGCTAIDMESFLCRSSLVSASATVASTWSALKSAVGEDDVPDLQKFGLFFGTLEGGCGAVVPVGEPVFRRLYVRAKGGRERALKLSLARSGSRVRASSGCPPLIVPLRPLRELWAPASRALGARFASSGRPQLTVPLRPLRELWALASRALGAPN